MRGRVNLLIHLVVASFLFSTSFSPLLADENETTSGCILEGTVTYHPDEERPWKFSRYYIKERKKGFLAEAVIALKRSNLKKGSPPRTVEVDQVAFQFVPETIAIQSGDSVKFTNSDEAVHNVMTNDGGKPFNVNMARQDTHTHQFNEAGGINQPVRIGCIYHGGMRAWIYVFDHPWYAISSKTGSFGLTNVPPGNYTLSLSHPAGRLVWEQPVTVAATDNARLDIHVSPDNIKKSEK